MRGFASRRKQYQVQRLLIDKGIDVLAIQETKVHSDEETVRLLAPFLPCFEVCVSRANGLSGGCMLFLRKSLNAQVQNVIADNAGRFVICDCNVNNVEYRIINVYAPNASSERKIFFQSMGSYLDCQSSILMIGDFNCVCDARDRSSTIRYDDNSTKVLKDLTINFSLVDVATFQRNNTSLRYTHYQSSCHARLDRAYVSIGLLSGHDGYNVAPVFFSDHALVSFVLGGRGKKKTNFRWEMWKLNNSLLEDDVFNETVEELFSKMAGVSESASERWEWFKSEFKLCAIERSGILAYWKKAEEKLLMEDLQRIHRLECENPGTFTEELKCVKSNIADFETEKYKGALVRARAEKYVLGEQPTKRALSSEAQYVKKKSIVEIEYGGLVSSRPDVIEKAFVDYYSAMLQRQDGGNDSQLGDYLSVMPRVNDEMKERLEEPISVAEIERTIEELPTKKSPGPDGLTAALYKKYKSEISEQLYQVIREAYMTNKLPPSFLNTHTVLIPKNDDAQKLRNVKNYRPIALSNVDYKVLMKVLARRLQNVITEIVGEHQTCAIKGRSILTNVHIARSLLELCDEEADQVAMLQIDLEKAFDRVQHRVMYRILEYVGVGEVITSFVKMAYTECTTQLIINGKPSARISVQSSVKQGCPLSPLLFCIYLEPFCRTILKNRLINGFSLHGTEVKLLSYADDVAIFCRDKLSIVQAVRDLKYYCDLTGAAVNWEKCCGLWHGTWATKPRVFQDINFMSTPTQYLGVPLQHYKSSKAYWSNVVKETRDRCSKWGGWELSIFTRATVCNIFLIAKIWYVLQVLACARVNVQKLHRVFAEFIWRSGWERICRDNLFRHVKNGGLSLSHIFVRQVVSRFMFLRDQSNPFLRAVIQTRLPEEIPLFVVSSCCRKQRHIGSFLREVVEAFRFLSVRFSLEYLSGVTRKRLTRDIIETVFPVPLYRSIFQASPGQDVLSRVKKMAIPPGIKTFFFYLHTNTLPVKVWLEQKNIFVPWGVHCFLCKKSETIEHVFLDCWDALLFWDVLQRTIKKELPLTPQGIRFLPVDKDGETPVDFIMVLGLHAIWQSRMAVRHADVDARPVWMYFVETVRRLNSVYATLKCPPDCVSVLNVLENMRNF